MRKFAFSLLLGVSAAALSGCYIFQPPPPANAQLVGKVTQPEPTPKRTTSTTAPRISGVEERNNDRGSSRNTDRDSNTNNNDNQENNNDNDQNNDEDGTGGGATGWGG